MTVDNSQQIAVVLGNLLVIFAAMPLMCLACASDFNRGHNHIYKLPEATTVTTRWLPVVIVIFLIIVMTI